MIKKYWREILILLIVITASAMMARSYSHSETLADYARKHPDIAYAHHKKEKGTQKTANSTQGKSSPSTTSQDKPDSSATSQGVPGASATSQGNPGSSAAAQDKPGASTFSQGKPSSQAGASVSGEKSSPDQVLYKDGFSYEPLSEEIILRIAGLSYPRDSITNPAKDVTPLQDLRYVKIRYVDFDGKAQNGELICNQKIAQDLVEIFSELYDRQYPLASVRLVDDFGGDDLASMEADNTSCFNFREVTSSGGGRHKLSFHAYGLAVDLNPLYNPYVKKGKILPQSAKPYANRKNANPYRIDHDDLAYQLFTSHGFTWGGDWKSLKDYQHFEKK